MVDNSSSQSVISDQVYNYAQQSCEVKLSAVGLPDLIHPPIYGLGDTALRWCQAACPFIVELVSLFQQLL